MGFDCRGICVRYKSEHQHRYTEGQKRCAICGGIYIDWEGTRCPCCTVILRVGPRTSNLPRKARRY